MQSYIPADRLEVCQSVLAKSHYVRVVLVFCANPNEVPALPTASPRAKDLLAERLSVSAFWHLVPDVERDLKEVLRLEDDIVRSWSEHVIALYRSRRAKVEGGSNALPDITPDVFWADFTSCLCAEMRRQLEDWFAAVFKGHVEFSHSHETDLYLIAQDVQISSQLMLGRLLFSGFRSSAALLWRELALLQKLLGTWISPQRSLSLSTHSPHRTEEEAADFRRRALELPPLPAEWGASKNEVGKSH